MDEAKVFDLASERTELSSRLRKLQGTSCGDNSLSLVLDKLCLRCLLELQGRCQVTIWSLREKSELEEEIWELLAHT